MSNSGWIFVGLLREMYHLKAHERVLDALRRVPTTVRGLANELSLPRPIVSLAISELLKRGHDIECRDWRRTGRKGTYHLVKEPEEGTL